MASKLLLVLVFVLDLIAFGLAVAAEQRRATVSSFPTILFFSSFCYIFRSAFGIILYTTVLGFLLFWVGMLKN